MALVEEDAVDDSFNRLIDRRIVKNNIRRLAAQLQREFFLRRRKRLLNQSCRLRCCR